MQPVLVDGTQFELQRRIEYLDNLFGALHFSPLQAWSGNSGTLQKFSLIQNNSKVATRALRTGPLTRTKVARKSYLRLTLN